MKGLRHDNHRLSRNRKVNGLEMSSAVMDSVHMERSYKMDLGAYAQIDNLEQIMKDNGIEVPRLRGLRLMKNEKPVSKEELFDMAKSDGLYRCVNLCQSIPPFNLNATLSEMSNRTDAICEYYLELPKYEDGSFNHLEPVGVRWDRVHGKKRKAFKYVIKQAKKKVFRQFDMWNKYCGIDDVLYIHARLGSGNWGGYDCDKVVKSQPWFLDYVEDYFDCTYVDIYAKIKTPEMKGLEE